MKKFICVLLVIMLLVAFAACSEGTVDQGENPPVIEQPDDDIDPGDEDPDDSQPDDGDEDTSGFIARERQEMPVAAVVDPDSDYGDPSSWAGDAYTSVDLGTVYTQDVIDDTVYDWGHSVIYEDGVYKMWWVRPAVYDSVYYAESTDLKNWTETQRVICLAPNSSNVTKYDNIKGMIGKPSVIHVDDTYYMYFEAPASEDPDVSQTVLEWDNQVLLATSFDGINWSFYSDSNGEPQPVISMPEELMGNTNDKDYGAGQPSVFYKDGKFYVTYCYVIYSQGIHQIRVASSDDGIHFNVDNSDPSTYTVVRDGVNGYGVTYNTKTEKYMMVSPTDVYESSTLDFSQSAENEYYTYDDTQLTTGFCEFVKNAHGLVETETFYTIHMQGDRSSTSDWRAEHTTWDGHIHAVNPAEYANKPFTLPNGGKATEANLAEYRDRTNTYEKQTADAIYAEDASIVIDGEKDAAYDAATKIEVTRPIYDWGSNLTDTWAEVWVAWNEEYLYVYGQVYDKTNDTSYAIPDITDMYMHDSIDIFVDIPNDEPSGASEVPYTFDQYIISIGGNNSDFVIKSGGEDDADISDEFETISAPRHRVRRTDYGYSFELRVEWYEFVAELIEENKSIGMDFQINDAMGHDVGREALVGWNDNGGNAFRYLDVLGDVYLIKS